MKHVLGGVGGITHTHMFDLVLPGRALRDMIDVKPAFNDCLHVHMYTTPRTI